MFWSRMMDKIKIPETKYMTSFRTCRKLLMGTSLEIS